MTDKIPGRVIAAMEYVKPWILFSPSVPRCPLARVNEVREY